MKHRIKTKKLNIRGQHKNSLMSNMSCSLFEHEVIRTTLPKAKCLKVYAEKLITKARNLDLKKRRELCGLIKSKDMLKKLINDIVLRNTKRKGGNIRVLKYGYRPGDRAPMAIVELVDKDGINTDRPGT